MNRLIIGTRGSPLALAQAEIIRGLLTKAHPQLRIDVKIIKTSGDQFNNLSLTAGGGKGLFTKEIEEQLLRSEIHVAVHSMKDLPTILPDGLTIGAVPAREDARDVFISKRFGSLDELPQGSHVATSSIRRRAQLLARRPDLQIEEIRGNVGTRLQKLADRDELDALILAAAGLKRLGYWDGKTDQVTVGAVVNRAHPGSPPQTQGSGAVGHRALPAELTCTPLATDLMIPAVGQGIIACEARESDFETQELLTAINHADTLACAEAERVFLRALGGGCQVPYAAHATVRGEQMKMVGAKFSPDGEEFSKTEAIGQKSDPHELGERAAKGVLQ